MADVDWTLYETMLGYGDGSKTKSEILKDDALNSFTEEIVNDPGYMSDTTVNDEITPMVATHKSGMECEITIPPPADAHIGDLVTAFDERWLITDVSRNSIGVQSGKMLICNDVIRFQNHSESVHTRPVVVTNETLPKKLANTIVRTPDNTFVIYLSIDEMTRKLFVGKRLSFGVTYDADGNEVLEAYKISGIDTKSMNFGEGSHLMILTMMRDVYDPEADSLEDNLCDVFIPADEESEPSVTGSCEITGRDSIRIGTTRNFTAHFYSPDGEELTDVVPLWNPTVPAGVEANIDGNTISVTVPLSQPLVGEEITILLSADGEIDFGTFEKKVKVIAVG